MPQPTPESTLIAWLKDACAMEETQIGTLEDHIDEAEEFPLVRSRLEQHLEQTRHHADEVRRCLERYGERPSAAKAALAKFGSLVHEIGTKLAHDEVVKNALMDHAIECFEIGAYISLITAARDVGDEATARACEAILRDERDMAAWLEQTIPPLTDQFLSRQVGV